MDIEAILVVTGRVMLGSLFVIGGLRHFPIFDLLAETLAARGVPFPKAAIIAATIFEIASGALLIAGVFAVPAALGLVIFTLLASFVALNFWDMEGEARTVMINMWLTNVAIIGGLLIVTGTAI